MNLVAKEYVAAQDEEDPGVLILSRFAGAASELRAAVLVNPYDHEAVAAAIARAFAMSLTERRQRHQELWSALLRNDIDTWGDRFLSALTGSPAIRTVPGADVPSVREIEVKPLAAE
jgi:trehalose 6-phosphate synthase